MASFLPTDFWSSLYLKSRCLFSLTFSPAILIPVTQLPPLIHFLYLTELLWGRWYIDHGSANSSAANQELAMPCSCHEKLKEGELEMGWGWYWFSESSWEDTRSLSHQFTTGRMCKTHSKKKKKADARRNNYQLTLNKFRLEIRKYEITQDMKFFVKLSQSFIRVQRTKQTASSGTGKNIIIV